MIAADGNVLMYLCLPTETTQQPEDLLQIDPDWASPILWRSASASSW